jgi:hypothetical protein
MKEKDDLMVNHSIEFPILGWYLLPIPSLSRLIRKNK